jgi:hypothetical protein
MEDYRGQCSSAFLNDQNFAITIGKPLQAFSPLPGVNFAENGA